MRARYLGQRLAPLVTFSLMLLIVGVLGFGMAMRYGGMRPPAVDVGYGMMRIVAYRAHDPGCLPYTPCTPESGAAHTYYMIWSISELTTAAQPYRRTANLLLVVPLYPEPNRLRDRSSSLAARLIANSVEWEFSPCA
jgi:hypothetical protein